MSKKKKIMIIIIMAAIVVFAIIGIVVTNLLKCDYPGCDRFSISNSKYCYAHTCKEDGCYNKKYSRDNHCAKHKYEIELDTFDVVTGAELIRTEDNTKKYTNVSYYYAGGETESECLELIKKYQEYLAANTDWKLLNSDNPGKVYAMYDMDVTQSFDLSMEQEEGVFTVKIQITG